MKASGLTPELEAFCKRLKITYSGGGHGEKWATRTYSLSIDDKEDIIGFQFVDTTRKGYEHEWRKGKVTYGIKDVKRKASKKMIIFKDLAEFLTELMNRENNRMKLV
jgi:hypothetical protein